MNGVYSVFSKENGTKARWRPISEPSTTYDVVLWQEAPDMRIITVVAVVTEDHNMTIRDDARSPVVVWRLVDEWFRADNTVNLNNSIVNIDGLSSSGNDTFDEGVTLAIAAFPKGKRRFKDDNVVVASRSSQSRNFVNKKLIANVKCWIH